MNFFKKAKANTYFDLPSRDRKKIVIGAVREANAEQLELVRGYDDKFTKYCKQTVD